MSYICASRGWSRSKSQVRRNCCTDALSDVPSPVDVGAMADGWICELAFTAGEQLEWITPSICIVEKDEVCECLPRGLRVKLQSSGSWSADEGLKDYVGRGGVLGFCF